MTCRIVGNIPVFSVPLLDEAFAVCILDSPVTIPFGRDVEFGMFDYIEP